MDQDKIESDHRPITLFGVIVLAIAAIVLTAWSTLAPIDSAAIAPGVLAVEEDRSTVQHLDGGIVKAVFIVEGDVVEQGDVLLELDNSATSAQLEVTRARYISQLALAARLIAEQLQQESVNYSMLSAANMESDDDSRARQAIETQNQVFLTRQQSLDGEVALLNERLRQLEARRQGLNKQLEINQARIAQFTDEIDRLTTLLDQGFVGRQPIMALERDRSTAEALTAQLSTEITETELTVGESQLEILQTQKRFQEQVAAELANVNADLPLLQEELTTYAITAERMLVRAPTNGKVLGLKVTSPGGVVLAGEPIMDIIPQNAPLIVKARVSPIDIDRVRIGLPAKINLSAFTSATTPAVLGHVYEVSADRVQDQNTGLEFYEARIRISADEVANLQLTPGMPADAMISTGEHTLFAYVVQPITDAFQRGMRED